MTKCLRCAGSIGDLNPMVACDCVEAWAPDEDTLYPEYSRAELERELLKNESALFVASKEKLHTSEFPAIVRQITHWQNLAKPVIADAGKRKLERNRTPKIEIVQ